MDDDSGSNEAIVGDPESPGQQEPVECGNACSGRDPSAHEQQEAKCPATCSPETLLKAKELLSETLSSVDALRNRLKQVTAGSHESERLLASASDEKPDLDAASSVDTDARLTSTTVFAHLDKVQRD